jgi:hypothetical protein
MPHALGELYADSMKACPAMEVPGWQAYCPGLQSISDNRRDQEEHQIFPLQQSDWQVRSRQRTSPGEEPTKY